MPTYKYLNDTGLERALSKLKTYIDSQSGGGSDGHGFIICDTSTMQVGDRIRVRSVYTVLEEPYNQTKEVVTIGQPVVFTVPCYDYYKICTVQTIDDTPTEIGGVYKTVDLGQTLFINVLDKTTLGGIQGILNAHQESSLLAIGDEALITVNGSSWIMQVGRIDTTNHAIDFVSKFLYSTSVWNSQGDDAWYSTGEACQQADAFYNSIAQEDKQYIKITRKKCSKSIYGGAWETIDKYVWLPKKVEVDGILQSSGDIGSQFDIFVTQANRIKTYNGTAISWWTCDGLQAAINPRSAYYINNTGSMNYMNKASSNGILPCFRLTADS